MRSSCFFPQKRLALLIMLERIKTSWKSTLSRFGSIQSGQKHGPCSMQETQGGPIGKKSLWHTKIRQFAAKIFSQNFVRMPFLT